MRAGEPWLSIAAKSRGCQFGRLGRMRDMEVEVGVFFLICRALLIVRTRQGKGPETREDLAKRQAPVSAGVSHVHMAPVGAKGE